MPAEQKISWYPAQHLQIHKTNKITRETWWMQKCIVQRSEPRAEGRMWCNTDQLHYWNHWIISRWLQNVFLFLIVEHFPHKLMNIRVGKNNQPDVFCRCIPKKLENNNNNNKIDWCSICSLETMYFAPHLEGGKAKKEARRCNSRRINGFASASVTNASTIRQESTSPNSHLSAERVHFGERHVSILRLVRKRKNAAHLEEIRGNDSVLQVNEMVKYHRATVKKRMHIPN